MNVTNKTPVVAGVSCVKIGLLEAKAIIEEGEDQENRNDYLEVY